MIVLMNPLFKSAISSQFGASLDMLAGIIEACPDEVWSDSRMQPQFWYLVYHTLFWLDRYLSGDSEDFAPPPPFTLEEMKPDGEMPPEPFAKAELLGYLEHGRKKCRDVIARLTDEGAAGRHRFGWGEASFAELLIYNLRHVQHGVGQLNLMLRQSTDHAAEWVAQV